MLITEAAPRAAKMLEGVTGLINEEIKLEATADRKRLLGTLADSRGSLAVGLASIRAYLLSGDAKFAEAFNKKWEVNTARLKSLRENSSLFTPEQVKFFDQYQSYRQEFDPLPAKMFAIRASDGWNVANKLLGTEAAPRGARAKQIIGTLIERQETLMGTDVAELASQTASLKVIVFAAALVGALIGCGVAWFITRGVTGPVAQMLTAIGAAARGDLTARVDIKTKDEIADLGRFLNELTENLEYVIREVVGNAGTLGESSADLTSTATQLAAGAEETTTQSAAVASAAEQMSANMTNVAGSTEEMSTNVKTVATATDDIRQRIEGIQGSTQETVHSIAEIGDAIKNVNEVSRTIASSVEEQSITTREIAQNVNQAAIASDAVARGVTEAAEASKEISCNVTGVDEAAKQAASGAARTQMAGQELDGLAGNLRQMLSQFRTSSGNNGNGAATRSHGSESNDPALAQIRDEEAEKPVKGETRPSPDYQRRGQPVSR